MPTDWAGIAIAGGSILIGLEVVFVFLRSRVSRFRPRSLYHLWAGVLAAWVVLGRWPEAADIGWLSRMIATSTLILSSLMAFAIVDALILQRPRKHDGAPLMPKLVRDVLRLVLVVGVGFYATTGIYAQDMSTVLVSSTVLSAIIGLAFQDTLKNVFSGMAMDLEKPFRRGDWLLLDGDRPVLVVDMSWRSTHLRTKEGVDVFEPNGNLAVSRLVNLGNGNRPMAVTIHIGLPYGVPPAEITEALTAACLSTPGALQAPPVRVFLEEFADHAITYRIRVWTRRVANFNRFRGEVNTRIWYELKRRNIGIPFPIRELHMHEAPDMEDHRRRKALEKAYDLFSKAEIFSALDETVVRQLAASSQRRLYDKGEIMVEEGRSGDSLFLIERGSVAVKKADPDRPERSIEVAQLGHGAFFGELSLLTGEVRSATVEAHEACGVLTLSKDALAPILAADESIVRTLGHALAERQRDTAATVEDQRGTAIGQDNEQAERNLLNRIRTFFSL